MNTFVWIAVAIGLFCCGYLIGATSNNNPDCDGEFVIDTTDPEKDICSLNLGVTYNEVTEKDYLVLKIVMHDEKS